MTYKLAFLETALKEWNELDNTLKTQFKKKPSERLLNPHIKGSKLRGLDDCYKIKLRSSGYRLIYKVIDQRITVQVIGVGKRDKNKIYKLIHKRLSK